MAQTEPQIQKYLKKSLIDEEMKTFWQKKLPELNDSQKQQFLEILQDEERLLKKAVDETNTPIYKKMIEDMKALAKKLIKKYREKSESIEKEQEQETLQNLEDELHNL